MHQWTIQKLLTWSAEYFQGRRVDSPRATAETLLSHCLNQSRLELYTQFDKPLNETELSRFKSLIKRRVRREPVAYITGAKGFWDLDLKVTPDVLIPRPETERLVENALAFLSDMENPKGSNYSLRILELGTGSGAVILSIASACSGHRYYASDRSLGALAVALENARIHDPESAVHFFSGDWFGPLSRSGGKFDLILSNPPYIKRGDIDGLQPEIVWFEPKAALDGGHDGLDAIRHIILRAHLFLNPGGGLLLEIGHDQKESVRTIAVETGRYGNILFFKDYCGIDRVVQMTRR